jgi:hypothetical protein
MTTRCEKAFQPTDTMHRRTPLPLAALFLLADYTVTIRTNSQALLSAAARSGLIAHTAAFEKAELQWEIVVETTDDAASGVFTCTVMRAATTTFLDMGPYQWFGCDLETGRGAGFIATSDSDQQFERNAIRYLHAITSNVRDALQGEANESHGR